MFSSNLELGGGCNMIKLAKLNKSPLGQVILAVLFAQGLLLLTAFNILLFKLVLWYANSSNVWLVPRDNTELY